MKYLIVFFINLLTVFPVFSQQNIIQGYIYDGLTRQPLAYANVSIEGVLGTITNEEGFYKYKFHDERKFPIIIQISYVGYESKLVSINSPDICKNYLNPKETAISEVVVKADFIYSLNSTNKCNFWKEHLKLFFQKKGRKSSPPFSEWK